MPFTVLETPKQKENEASKFTVLEPAKEAPSSVQKMRGAAQGGLDIMGLASLPLYPLEKGIQAIYGTPSEPGISPQQEARFGGQFDTLNRLQEQPGYMPSMEELQALSDDEIGGGQGSSLARLHQVQETIPEGGLTQEATRRVTRSLPFAATGALGPVLGAEFTGLGAREAVRALGGGETAQTIADVTGGLGYGLKDLFTKTATKNIPAVAQREGGIMQALEKQSPHAMEKRIFSLSEGTIKDFERKIADVTDKEISKLSQFSAREIEDAISLENRSKILEKITSQEQLPQQAWKGIQESAHSLFEAEQNVYKPLYNNVRNTAKNITANPEKSVEMAKNILNKIGNLKTSPAGYSQTENLVRDALHDLTSGARNADKLMDLSIRLNDFINYEALTPSIKDWIKPLQKTIKEEFRESLKNQRPSALQAFNRAEDLYKNTANRFGKDAISTLRSTESPEKMANVFSQPSNFENLVKLFGKNSPEVLNAERQIVEQIGQMNTKAAKDLFSQLEPYLSKNAQEAGKEVIALGDKLSLPGQRRAMQQSMLQDVAEAVTTGQPPNYTTRAMMTPEGYQTAKSTFARTEGGRELFKTLEKKLVGDLLDSVITEGQINWQKAAQILDNPNTATVMQQIIGTDGVSMLQNMQKYGKNITSNLNGYKNQSPSVFNKFINKLDSPSKLMLAAIVGKAFALPLWLTGAAGTLSLKRLMAGFLTNPKLRESVKMISNPDITGKALLNEVNILNSELLEELA